jgi:hypothetical protein
MVTLKELSVLTALNVYLARTNMVWVLASASSVQEDLIILFSEEHFLETACNARTEAPIMPLAGTAFQDVCAKMDMGMWITIANHAQ